MDEHTALLGIVIGIITIGCIALATGHNGYVVQSIIDACLIIGGFVIGRNKSKA